MMNLTDAFPKYPLKTININGVDWEYITSGNGKKTLVLLPGGGQIAQSNIPLIQELEKDFSVIALTVYRLDSIDDFCKALDKILATENVTKIHLYGLSVGGLLAQSYAKRNQDRVESLIISHACTPKSKTYKRKIIIPLKLTNFLLPIIPGFLINKLQSFAGQIQGVNKNLIAEYSINPEMSKLNKAVYEYFISKYSLKTLIRSWINIHMDFYNHEDFSKDDFADWKAKVLVLRTDNDPLMQDEGEFQKVYPNLTINTFNKTGHMTFYLQFEKMAQVIRKFLNEL